MPSLQWFIFPYKLSSFLNSKLIIDVLAYCPFPSFFRRFMQKFFKKDHSIRTQKNMRKGNLKIHLTKNFLILSLVALIKCLKKIRTRHCNTVAVSATEKSRHSRVDKHLFVFLFLENLLEKYTKAKHSCGWRTCK